MTLKILLIEDAEESRDLVYSALGSSFEVIWASTLQKANQLINKGSYDLILLDVGLPDGDGFHFFSSLRNEEKYKTIPIIFLTARDSDSDKVLGISMGAEDYMIKPFSPLELKARVEMRIKKNAENMEKGQIIKKGSIEMNLAEQRVFLNTQNKKTDLGLTSLEFKIMVLLLKNEEHVFSREKLLNQVWGQDTFLTDRCIDTHVYSLRKKLGPLSVLIQSVYGQGYRFSIKEIESNDEKLSTKKVA